MSKKKLEIREIIWLDSMMLLSNWNNPEDIDHQLPEIKTSGYVLFENKRTVTITESYTAECVGPALTIPKFAIIKSKTLVKGKH